MHSIFDYDSSQYPALTFRPSFRFVFISFRFVLHLSIRCLYVFSAIRLIRVQFQEMRSRKFISQTQPCDASQNVHVYEFKHFHTRHRHEHTYALIYELFNVGSMKHVGNHLPKFCHGEIHKMLHLIIIVARDDLI